jgi:type II secretory pathway pseudopilin PulG
MNPMIKRIINRQPGLGLVETLVAVAILGIAVVAFVIALSVGSTAVGAQDEATATQGLAQSQLEYVKSQPYDPGAVTYPALATPPGYDLTVAVAYVPGADADIQKITVTVLRDGDNVLTVSDYKVNR